MLDPTQCPYCKYKTPEPADGDLDVRGWQEVAHMQVAHRDIIQQRLRDSGLLDAVVDFGTVEEDNGTVSQLPS